MEKGKKRKPNKACLSGVYLPGSGDDIVFEHIDAPEPEEVKINDSLIKHFPDLRDFDTFIDCKAKNRTYKKLLDILGISNMTASELQVALQEPSVNPVAKIRTIGPLQLEKKQKDNQRRLRKRRRLINKANKDKESENLEKVTTDAKGNVLPKRVLNVDMLAPKGSARMAHYEVDKEMSVGRNIYKGVFDTIKYKFRSETSINSHRQIQNYKPLSRTRNDGKNNERILDMYNSFFDREAMCESLQQGATLAGKDSDALGSRKRTLEKSATSFKRTPQNHFTGKRLSRDEYKDISAQETKNYKDNRLEDYHNNSVRPQKSIEKEESRSTPREEVLNHSNSDISPKNRHYISMADQAANLGMLGSTPRFAESHKYSNRVSMNKYSLNFRMGQNRIIHNNQNSVSTIVGDEEGHYELKKSNPMVLPLEDQNLTSLSIANVGRYAFTAKNSVTTTSNAGSVEYITEWQKPAKDRVCVVGKMDKLAILRGTRHR